MTPRIRLSNETKRLIRRFGSKQDTYEKIIKKMYTLAVKGQLREFLMSSKNTISIKEALAKVKNNRQNKNVLRTIGPNGF